MTTELAELTELRAGSLTLTLDGADLRYVAYGGEEIVRRVYMAVRDPDWATIPAEIVSRSVEAGEDSFAVRMAIENRGGDVAFDWELEASGGPEGIEYAMRATARASFDFAKIGLNLHHPIAGLAGRRWSGRGPEGELGGVVSDLIYPQIEVRSEAWHIPQLPPVYELELDHEVGPVRLDFGGDLWEMEDQRNWSDASYKSYSLPAELGYAFHAEPGDEFVQRVRISFEPREEARVGRRAHAGPPREPEGELELGPPNGRVVPPLGLAHAGRLDPAADERLTALAPSHLRLDVRLAEEGWESDLAAGLGASAALGAAAELAIHLARDPRPALARIARAVAESRARVARVIVLLGDEESTPANWVALVRESLGFECPIGGGTDMNFNELNRSVFDLRPFQLLSWAINPQVHAFTERDIVENLEGQSEQVRSARALAGGREVVVSPLSLKARFNAVARPDAPPADNVDPRQGTLFAAAWTLGSVARLAGAGADAVTYYETSGPRGVLEGAETFPLYHVLADACELRGAALSSLASADEPWLCGLAAEREGALVLLVANLTDGERTVRVGPLRARGGRLRVLDAGSEELARTDPVGFRRGGEPVGPLDGSIAIDLGPYASARLELT